MYKRYSSIKEMRDKVPEMHARLLAIMREFPLTFKERAEEMEISPKILMEFIEDYLKRKMHFTTLFKLEKYLLLKEKHLEELNIIYSNKDNIV